MTPKAQFNALKRELGLPSHHLARLLGRPASTVSAWGQPARTDCQPPREAIERMEDELIARAIERIRTAGLDVIPRKAA
jgi:hypothetical protein